MRTQRHFFFLSSDFLQITSPKKKYLLQKPSAVPMGKHSSWLFRGSLSASELALTEVLAVVWHPPNQMYSNVAIEMIASTRVQRQRHCHETEEEGSSPLTARDRMRCVWSRWGMVMASSTNARLPLPMLVFLSLENGSSVLLLRPFPRHHVGLSDFR